MESFLFIIISAFTAFLGLLFYFFFCRFLLFSLFFLVSSVLSLSPSHSSQPQPKPTVIAPVSSVSASIETKVCLFFEFLVESLLSFAVSSFRTMAFR